MDMELVVISSSVEAWDEDAFFQYLLTLSQIFQN